MNQGFDSKYFSRKREIFWVALWALVLLPFFEPWSLDYLIGQGCYVFPLTIIANFNILARGLISLAGCILFARKYRPNAHMKCLMAISAAIVISSISSYSSASLATIANALQYIGFAAMLFYMFETSEKRAVCAISLSFGLLAIAAILSVVFTDGGFTMSSDPASAIYSFGGKNSAFVTFVPFIAAIGILSTLLKNRRLLIVPSIASVCFAALSFYVQSASSTICFLAVALLLIPKGETVLFSKIIRSDYLTAGILVVFVGTVLTSVIPELLNQLFALIGRDSSLTGRTFLWDAALRVFASSPIIGAGPDIVYYSEAGTYMGAQAHCTILDLLAKYGLLALAPFLADIALGVRNERKARGALLLPTGSSFAIACFMLMLFHGLFDDTPFYFYLVTRSLYLRFGCSLRESPRKMTIQQKIES